MVVPVLRMNKVLKGHALLHTMTLLSHVVLREPLWLACLELGTCTW